MQEDAIEPLAEEPQIKRIDNGVYLLTASTVVRSPIEATFAFFAEPQNLNAITPPWLDFRILTPPPVTVGEGALIDYTLRLHRFPVKWRSRIEDWSPNQNFTDVQVRGPYRYWRHEHLFADAGGGATAVTDRVTYRVPGGVLVHRLFVRRDLLRIFAFRQHQISRLLN